MNSGNFDLRVNDGSRHFTSLPEMASYDRMRDQLRLLRGAVESDFVTDSITEMWLDFDYERHRFSINNQMGEYLFFVDDPDCPEEVLTAVRDHFAIINPR